MSDTMTVAERESRQPGHVRTGRRKQPLRWRASACALALVITVAACGDFHISTGQLTISPVPARPGDMVTASFVLNLIPAESHTIMVVIDSVEHMRVTDTGAPQNPIILQLGDAADLIAEYGAGEHAIHVRVHANDSDEETRTRWAQLLLEAETTDDTP